jgi:hypothetical protein
MSVTAAAICAWLAATLTVAPTLICLLPPNIFWIWSKNAFCGCW